jgi:2-polyprenyl-6-methoxyphenol hydroxylase-like FAD-dependent oxidoreductase
LISGAGIVGPTLAFWLKAAGFEPTLIEYAPSPRTTGYVIDFWGLGAEDFAGAIAAQRLLQSRRRAGPQWSANKCGAKPLASA